VADEYRGRVDWSSPMPPASASAPTRRRVPWRALLTGAGALLALVIVLAGVSSPTTPQTDLAPPVLDGSAGYRFIHVDAVTGLPSRFDPCSEVPYVVNLDGAPDGALADVEEAFRRAELATGIRFRSEGTVDETPQRGRSAYQPERYGDRWAPILVGWVPMPAETGQRHAGAVVGWGAHTPLVSNRVQDVVTSGTIALDRDARSVRTGFGAGRRWGNILLHELGHVLGLDHIEADGQVMAPTVDHGAGRWGQGDLAGLAYLGREAGCLEVPRPRDVDMAPEPRIR
jgi:hypothetical protein